MILPLSKTTPEAFWGYGVLNSDYAMLLLLCDLQNNGVNNERLHIWGNSTCGSPQNLPPYMEVVRNFQGNISKTNFIIASPCASLAADLTPVVTTVGGQIGAFQ
jgi:hypothetical protein